MKKIIWISGKCGYGKTTLAKSIIKKFKRKNKKTYKLSGRDFISLLIKLELSQININNLISTFQNYELIVLDDMDYYLLNKPFTQKATKKIIRKITANNKTKVILITQKRPRKLKELKFNSNECFYKRLKAPSLKIKKRIVEKWLKEKNKKIPREKINDIINKTNNLFKLRGLLNQITFSIKDYKEKVKV
jgi:chromosomal replication initiation ATPase DnaA